jgi:hypothetical protein
VLFGHQFGRHCGGFDRNGSQNGYQDNTLTAFVCPACALVRTLPMRYLGYRRREILLDLPLPNFRAAFFRLMR